MDTGLASLQATALNDRAIREGLEALIEKERKLAELELLARLNEAGTLAGSQAPKPVQTATQTQVIVAASNKATKDGNPALVHLAAVAPNPSIPSGMLRPRAGRPELTAAEVALFKGPRPAKCGISLSHMRITDETLSELKTVIQSLTSEGAQLRILDLSHNELQKAGALEVVEAVGRFPKLEALHVPYNELGGKVGLGAIIDIGSRAPCIGHIGLSLNEATPLPFSLEFDLTPPGLGKASTGTKGKKGAAGKSTSPKKSGARSASPARAKAGGARGKSPVKKAVPSGTLAHLASAMQGNSTIASVSLAGSAMEREPMLKFLAAWAQPPAKDWPIAPSLTKPAPASPKKAAAGRGRSTTPSAKSPSRATSKGKSPSKGAAAAKKPYFPLQALDLSGLHMGALGAQDIGVAMGHVPTGKEDPLGRLGVVMGPGAIATAPPPPPAPPDSAAPAAVGRGRASTPGRSTTPAPAPAPVVAKPPAKAAVPVGPKSIHGSLQYIRVLNLSSCRLTTLGVMPVLESLARDSLCLSHLILRDNFLDDAAALALSTATRLNHARIAAFTADAAEVLAAYSPIGQLSGKQPDMPVERLEECKRTLAVLHGAGLHPVHASMLRVIDVRNNPLYVSQNDQYHPGCAALSQCLEDLPALVTLTGPGPSLEGLLHLRAKTIGSKPAPEDGGKGLGDDTLAGWGEEYFLDLSSISHAAKEARSGCLTTGPQHVLGMPGRYAQDAATATLAKVRRMVDGLEKIRAQAGGKKEESGPGSSLLGRIDPSAPPRAPAGKEEVGLLWSLPTPRTAQVTHRGITSSGALVSRSGALQLAALQSSGPQDASLAAHPSHLGSRILSLSIPAGLAGHAGDVPAVVQGVPTWALRMPRLMVEWRACYTAPASAVHVAQVVSLVWHVVVTRPGGRPVEHVYSGRFGEGSRDRMHARQRMLTKLDNIAKRAAGEGGQEEGLLPVGEYPGVAASLLSSAAMDGGSTLAQVGRSMAGGHLAALEWQDASGLDTPRPLGQHNDVNAGVALPPALVINAVMASGAQIAAWPVAWHSALLPAHLLTVAAGATVEVYAEVVQTTVRNAAGMIANHPACALPTPYAVHLLEGELVALETGPLGPHAQAGVQGGYTARPAGAIRVQGVQEHMEGSLIPFTF